MFVVSEAIDPKFRTIHLQYDTSRSSSKLNTSGTVWRRRRRKRRRIFQGVTFPLNEYILKKQLCRMEASSAKGAQFHLYVNICSRNFSMTIFKWG